MCFFRACMYTCSVEAIGIKSALRLYHSCVFHDSFCFAFAMKLLTVLLTDLPMHFTLW